jgi:chemotaxis protein histidine kinase CheA/ActR/RegA family two-component response regulator
MRARTVPVGTVTGRLHRAVRDTAKAGGKDVAWLVDGEDTELDRAVLHQLTDCLVHIVRNAVDHGIEAPAERVAAGKAERAVVRLTARNVGSEVVISVTDDGHGIDVDRLRERAAAAGIAVAGLDEHEIRQLVFCSGLSTATTVSETSGRGVGLDVVRENVERLRGRVELLSVTGEGTEFRIVVPVAAAVVPCLVVCAGSQRFAVPLASVRSTQAAGGMTRAQGVDRVWVGDSIVPLASLAATLGVGDGDEGPIIVVGGRRGDAAYRVSSIGGQRDVMVAGLGPFVPKLPLVAGATVEADGSVLFVLDGEALAAGGVAPARGATAGPVREAAPAPRRRVTVLVADDSLPVRELQRSILEDAGYRVVVAEDGAHAVELLAEHPVDLVLTDVDMPRLDGFGLARAIRAREDDLANLPIVLLTARSDPDDRAAGLDAGADEYIVKRDFDEAALLAAVERLVGEAA